MVQSSELIWWHFSDLHWQTGQSSERKRFSECLFSHLKENLKEFGKPDFIVMSGDISYSGDSVQFQEVETEFFSRLREACSDDSIHILCVPGNHDLSRKVASMMNPELITSIDTIPQLDEFLDDEIRQKFIQNPFENFSIFCESIAPNIASPALSWSHQLEIKGQNLYVVGVNTAWASGYYKNEEEVEDERRLLLGLQQFDWIQQPTEKVDVSILIMHHPLNWLKGVFQNPAKNYIQKHFDFVLFGHTHTVHELATRTEPRGQSIYLPSLAIYDRTNTDSIEYARGYNIVVYNTSTRSGKAYYYRYSTAHGDQFSPFIEIYGRDKKYVELHLSTKEVEGISVDEYKSYQQIIDDIPNLKKIDLEFRQCIGRRLPNHHSVNWYEQLSFKFVNHNALMEVEHREAFWECFLICRSFLIFELLECESYTNRFDIQRVNMAFEQFLRRIIEHPEIELSISPSLYNKLSVFNLEQLSLSSTNYKGIPEYYIRYYSSFWIFSQIAFYFNYPKIIPFVLSTDSRIGNLELPPELVPDMNIITGNYDERNSQLSLELRIESREGFLAVSTLKHYIDNLIRETSEFWRQNQRIYPPLVLLLEYPTWGQKDISSSYLGAETTPVVKLLMGKAFYRGETGVWFREILQNALDANSTRQALESSDYTSKTRIHHDGHNVCSISDNGVGMSYQHIVRYLTVLGRSIWTSDELEEEENDSSQKDSRTIGKFGIGFVSVFQDAERVYVRTRFFRDIGEDGWLVDFTAVDKPFFIERDSPDLGTEVRVILKERLTMENFKSLVNKFFLYVDDSIEIIPNLKIPKTLEDVPLLPEETLKKSIYKLSTSEQEMNGNEFWLRTLFCYHYAKDHAKDELPLSYLQVSNAGAKIFNQDSVQLKPGKHYVWVEDEETKDSYSSPGVLKHFWIILDFKKGYSPILPSRMEIDIDPDFSKQLLRVIYKQFCDGLESVIRELAGALPDDPQAVPKWQKEELAYLNSTVKDSYEQMEDLRTRLLELLRYQKQRLECKKQTESALKVEDLKLQREKILSCLMDSVKGDEGSRWRSPRFCSVSEIEEKAIDLYYKYCPLLVQDADGSKQFIGAESLNAAENGIYVLDTISKTGLFKVYARSLNITEWVLAESGREFCLIDLILKPRDWDGIFNQRDLYDRIRPLLVEKVDSPLTQFMRGDYALIDSDIFENSAYIKLPADLPKSWERAKAASYTRSKVHMECPARVLLNINHELFEALHNYLSNAEKSAEELKVFELTFNNFADGVIDQNASTVARERWHLLKEEFNNIIGVSSLEDISYYSLKG